MKQPESGTYADIRRREREVGMRGRRSKCRLCESELKRAEEEEGVCDSCLRAHSTHVQTESPR